MAKRIDWSEEKLRDAVSRSTSLAGVLEIIGLGVSGGNYFTTKKRIREYGIDTSHFSGQHWRKGYSGPGPTRIPLEKILVQDSDYGNVSTLRARLIREGVKEKKCESCGLDEWMGKEIPLQLHHVNGVRDDHRIENIEILCPNCHALTDNWCSKNRGS